MLTTWLNLIVSEYEVKVDKFPPNAPMPWKQSRPLFYILLHVSTSILHNLLKTSGKKKVENVGGPEAGNLVIIQYRPRCPHVFRTSTAQYIGSCNNTDKAKKYAALTPVSAPMSLGPGKNINQAQDILHFCASVWSN